MRFAILSCAVALVACESTPMVPGAALERITANGLARDIQVLASDSFGGRGPSSPGEVKTVAYLIARFQSMGLEPGNGDSWTQDVPLVSINAVRTGPLVTRGGGRVERFAFGPQYVAWTKRVVESSALEASEFVFVGYGIVAPEYAWDDYVGLDVRGKTVIILVNDPGFATQDSTLFTGNAMTYYGRWTYKFEEAARQGAAGAFVVHETAPAAYGWNVVESSWTGPQFDLERPDGNASRVAVEGWLSHEAALAIFAQSGAEYEQLKARAAQRGFRPVSLGTTATLSLGNAIERSRSQNVVARLPGGAARDEYVLYTAHWDHLGTDPTATGDGIYNGAVDNATGTAALLSIAHAYAALGTPPRRSVLFLAVTAEEQGLLGSAHFGAEPTVPLRQIVAAINMDGMNVNGPMRDVMVIGYGKSELDAMVEQAAAVDNRVVIPDTEPEKGYYYRSDHFSLAKYGVPAVYADAGIDHVEHGPEWTRARTDAYRLERYHQPSDEYDPTWDLTGLAQDARLLLRVGYRLAVGGEWPNWHPGTEFRAARDAMAPGRAP
ncbi:MAG: M28 family metallopeptidase [Gemmatimonadales bacterium]